MIKRALFMIACGALLGGSGMVQADAPAGPNGQDEEAGQTNADGQVAEPATSNTPPPNFSPGPDFAPTMDNLPSGLALTVDTTPIINTTPTTPDSEIKADTVSSGTTISPVAVVNGYFVINATGQLVLHNQLVNANSGVSISTHAQFEDTEQPWSGNGLIPVDKTNYYQLVAQAQVTALDNFVTNSSSQDPDKKLNANDLVSFLSRAQTLAPLAAASSDTQTSLANLVMTVLQNNAPDADNRPLILNSWPQLKKALTLTSAQQLAFYQAVLESQNVSLDECKAVLALANAPDAPADAADKIKDWTDQVSAAEKLDDQMENALVTFFNDPVNKLALQKTAKNDELAKPLDFPAESEAVFSALKTQLAAATLPCIKNVFDGYDTAWQRLKLLAALRTAMATNNLWSVESTITQLSPDPASVSSMTPGQKQVAEACADNLSIYCDQKAAVQKLIDEADQLRAQGAQSDQALQDYQSAYQLDHDPAILQKIKDLRNQSLGI